MTMKLDKDISIPMRDGAELKANLFRPEGSDNLPVLMSFGPYGKDVHLSQFMPEAWERISNHHPEILASTSAKHLVFETADPEMWVAHGYAVLKVDSRGAGKSPGRLDVNSPTEFRDFYDAIEWAGTQAWSNGKVGLLGISYYAAGQWQVGSMRPPHLAAMLPWQGTFDFFRDRTRQDGIFASGFLGRWWPRSVLRNQHGNPDSPFIDIVTGERNTGPASLSSEELKANRADYIGNIQAHPTLDAWYQERIPDLSKVEVPTFVVANWGGLALHLRGTIAGFMGIGSREKWLKVQAGSYFITFLQPENVAMQRRFFDRYLKGIDNGWEKEPPVTIEVRSPDDKIQRLITTTEWPVPATRWTKFHLDAAGKSLGAAPKAAAQAGYAALSEGLTFTSAPMEQDTEIAGPVKVKLHVASTTDDMDIFATLRAFGPDGKEATFLTAIEPKAPVSMGWLRVSQRKLHPKATEWWPHHSHDEIQKLTPGEVYEVDVEIWPTSLFLPRGHRLALTVQGKDFERLDEPGPNKGSGWFLHNDPTDRPSAIFGGTNTIHTGGGRDSYLMVPVIPA